MLVRNYHKMGQQQEQHQQHNTGTYKNLTIFNKGTSAIPLSNGSLIGIAPTQLQIHSRTFNDKLRHFKHLGHFIFVHKEQARKKFGHFRAHPK